MSTRPHLVFVALMSVPGYLLCTYILLVDGLTRNVFVDLWLWSMISCYTSVHFVHLTSDRLPELVVALARYLDAPQTVNIWLNGWHAIEQAMASTVPPVALTAVAGVTHAAAVVAGPQLFDVRFVTPTAYLVALVVAACHKDFPRPTLASRVTTTTRGGDGTP